ncbi:MAG: hypothetical protein ACLFTT_10730 [Candidatus Hydrogenedentota bacterium]
MAKIKLDKQEQVGIGVAALAIMLVIAGLLYIPSGPLRDYRESEQRVEKLRSDLNLTRSILLDEARRVESQRWIEEALDRRGQSFSLLQFLDGVKSRVGLSQAGIENKPAPRGLDNVDLVGMEVTGMSLEQCIDLFHEVYSANQLIVVYSMSSLGPSNRRQGLDLSITFLTLKR